MTLRPAPRWRDWPLAVKLTVMMVGVAILPLTLITIARELTAREEVLTATRARSLQRAENTAALIRRYFDDVVADVRVTAVSPLTVRALERRGDPALLAELRETLHGARKAKGHDALHVLDDFGDVIASTDPAQEGRNRVAAPFFLWANAGQSRIHEPRYLADDGQVHINASVPVRSSGGRIIGVAVTRISLDEVDLLVGADTGFGSAHAYGLLWDDRGIVLSSPGNIARRFRPLGRLQASARDRLIAEGRFGPDTAALLDGDIGGEHLVQRSRWRLYDDTTAAHTVARLDGEELEVVSVPIGRERWTYAIAVPRAQVLAAIRAESRRNLLVAAGAALLALMLGVAVASWVSQPLAQVRTAAGALAAGDMSRRARLERRDEIGELAAAFDQMADALSAKDAELRQHAQDLERRVEERTADLRASEERTRFLARAGASLAASLDQDSIADALARLAVPVMGNFCMVDLLERTHVRCAAIAAADADVERRLRALRADFPLSTDRPSPAIEAMRTGRTRVLQPAEVVTLRQQVARSSLHRQRLDAFGRVTAIVVPLVARGRRLGTITVGETGGTRIYGDVDVLLAEELAHRAAVALENAGLYRDLQESSRLKDEFLGVVSHELRTPLNALLGWAHVLRRGGFEGEQAVRALDAIERNARAQAQLVEDLLDTSRVISGKLSVSLQSTDVRGVVEQVVESFRPLAASRGVTLTIEPGDPGPQVQADPARLEQIVGNLLSNAVKFTPPDGSITVGVARRDADIEIRVADSGIGIAPEFLPHVFERFRQADSTTTRAHGGLGIGLAIARHLVELHGGTIRAESEGENRGATFIVQIPVMAAAVETATTEAAPPVPGPALHGIHVLVVDDEADARELLRVVFEEAGAEVTLVAGADEALAAMAASRPHVLVSDIGLPRRDGYSLIREVREIERRQRLPPVAGIAVSAYARSEDRIRSLRSGFDRHLSKPLDPADVVAAAHAAMFTRSAERR